MLQQLSHNLMSTALLSSGWYLRGQESPGALLRVLEVLSVLPLEQVQCWSDWQWSCLVLSSKIVDPFLCLSPPGYPWYDGFRFVPARSLFSSAQIFGDAGHIRRSLYPPTTFWVLLFCLVGERGGGGGTAFIPTSLTAPSNSLTLACPERWFRYGVWRCVSNIVTHQYGLLSKRRIEFCC